MMHNQRNDISFYQDGISKYQFDVGIQLKAIYRNVNTDYLQFSFSIHISNQTLIDYTQEKLCVSYYLQNTREKIQIIELHSVRFDRGFFLHFHYNLLYLLSLFLMAEEIEIHLLYLSLADHRLLGIIGG